MLVRHKANIHS